MHYISQLGKDAFDLASKLWNLPRSLTGSGFNQSLDFIENFIGLPIKRIAYDSGINVYDWTVPDQWEVDNAYIIDPHGNKICDFNVNNLHLVSYSVPFSGSMTLNELLPHIYTLPNNPRAIPYVTAYYSDEWGFCMSEELKNELPNGVYKVEVNTRRFAGKMVVGEIFIPGINSRSEILLSTYLCHPSMANNELSGPVVVASLVKQLVRNSTKRGIRVLFVPETIGSIAYIYHNLEKLKQNVIAGFVLTCIGDEGQFSYLPSRAGNTLSDKVARRILNEEVKIFKEHSWLTRGSDERQYCSPGIDLPIGSLMRTKYGEFPEYHTSLDKLGTVVTESGLSKSIEVCEKIIRDLADSYVPFSIVKCEPNLGKRGLYELVSFGNSKRQLLDILTYADGSNTITEICNILKIDADVLLSEIKILSTEGLIRDL